MSATPVVTLNVPLQRAIALLIAIWMLVSVTEFLKGATQEAIGGLFAGIVAAALFWKWQRHDAFSIRFASITEPLSPGMRQSRACQLKAGVSTVRLRLHCANGGGLRYLSFSFYSNSFFPWELGPIRNRHEINIKRVRWVGNRFNKKARDLNLEKSNDFGIDAPLKLQVHRNEWLTFDIDIEASPTVIGWRGQLSVLVSTELESDIARATIVVVAGDSSPKLMLPRPDIRGEVIRRN